MDDLMTAALEEILSSSFKLRKTLEQVLPKEAVDYILQLIAKDSAHRKYLKIVEEHEDDKVGKDEVGESFEPVEQS